MKSQTIPLTEILDDKTYQLRDSSQGKNIPELIRLIKIGVKLHPITLKSTDDGYLIIDGFQRVEALRQTKGESATICAKVLNVDHNTAMIMAAAANQTHGQQLEKADKAKIVKKLLMTFPKMSNVEIAKLAFLSEGTIRKYRKENPKAQTSTRIGADGREISLPSKKQHTDISLDQPEPILEKGEPSPIDDATPTSSDKETPAEVQSFSPIGSHNLDVLIKPEPETPDRSKPASPSPHKPMSSFDRLLEQCDDLLDNLGGVHSFIRALKEKDEFTDEESEQLAAIKYLFESIKEYWI